MRDDEIFAPADPKFADHGEMRAAQNPQNFSIGAAVALDAADAHHHTIAVHGARRRFFRNIDVAFQSADGTIRNQEGVAVAMHAQASGGELARRADRHVMPRPRLHDLAAFGELLELGFELRSRDAAARKLAQKLFQIRAPMRQTADVFEHQPSVY